MNSKKVLVVCDDENRAYWNTAIDKLTKRIGPVRVAKDKKLTRQILAQSYDFVLINISDLRHLQDLIPRVHNKLPESQIIIVTSAPTWKHTREYMRLGATNLVRKSQDLDELIDDALSA